MITNERQYRITRKQVFKFELAIQELDRVSDHGETTDPRMIEAECDALKSQLESLNQELSEYDRLKSGDTSMISAHSLEQLPTGLIQARIAGGLTQRALAEKLGIKEQQIQRYEAKHYSSASLHRLCQVAQVLNLRIECEIFLPADPEEFNS